MKNLTKIFMAVVALFAVSCVTDTTGDLAPELGSAGNGHYSLTLSLEESRTQLGTKVDNVYPLYWSEGDAIAVNGVASDTLTEEQAGSASATFSFAEGVEHAYHIVYPAPASEVTAVTEGCYPVVFPATQSYVAGNIDGKAAPMYGYATTESDVPTLNHLTGVLRVAVKGAVTLSSLTVKVESGAIAGTFDVNCETGALTVQEGSTSDTTSVLFGEEGLALNAEEATPIYVAVPKGEYGAVRLILTTTEGKKMTITFNTASKPIAEGKVREFPEFAFAENTLEGDVFEIYDIEDMKMFAKAATAFPWNEAKLMATIDMADVDWTPVDGFSKIFDGNKGAGFEIKNLSAPLFGTTTATIKNVKLTDVNINISGVAMNIGSVVRVLQGGTVENCEASGTITLSAPTAANAYGGIVGTITTNESTLTNLTNRCNISVSISTNVDCYVGGILGKTNKKLTITGCTNHGAVSVGGENTARTRVGGIIGYLESGGTTTGETLNNYGTVTVEHTVGSDSHVAGIVGSVYAASTLTSSTNQSGGKVIVKGTPGGSSTGGVVGYASSALNLDDCHNCDSVKINITNAGQAMMGGIIAYNNTTSANTIEKCSNSGVIYAEGSVNGNHCRAGGFIGYSNSNTTIKDSANSGDVYLATTTKAAFAAGFVGFATGNTLTNLTNTGKITYAGTATGEDLQIGGIVGQGAGTFTGLTNGSENDTTGELGAITVAETASVKRHIYAGGVFGRGAATLNTVTNYAPVSFKSSCNTYNAGGVVGYASGTVTTANNYGALEFAGSTGTNSCRVGGVVGYTEKAVSGATNNAALTLGGTAKTYYAAGGVVGYGTSAAPVSNATNNGVLTFGGTATSYYAAGGVVGESLGALTSLTNASTGTITFNGISAVNHNVGGVVGRVTGKDLTTLTNNAALTYSGQTTASSTTDTSGYQDVVCVGGVAGAIIGTETTLNNVTDLTNSGIVTLSNFEANGGKLATPYANFGGVIGFVTNCNLDNCDNTATAFNQEATATIKKLEASSNKHQIRIGGVVGLAPSCGTIQNCDNSAALNLKGYNYIHHRVGGLIGTVTAIIEKCTNSGAINMSDNFTTAQLHMGGITGSTGGTSIKECSNSGAISYNSNPNRSSKSNRLYVGGILGNTATAKVEYCKNSADITLGEKCTGSSAVTYIGGVVGTIENANAGIENSAFVGTLTVSDAIGQASPLIGGIVGSTVNSVLTSYAYCSIVTELTKRGWIMGTARSQTIQAQNCHLGAMPELVYDEALDSWGPGPAKFNQSNFFNYIYGGTTDWTGVENYDGCQLLNSAEEIPELKPAAPESGEGNEGTETPATPEA